MVAQTNKPSLKKVMVENFINYPPFLRQISSKCFWQVLGGIAVGIAAIALPASKVSSQPKLEEIQCDILVVGHGVAGVATAYESLKAGRTVCLTGITDWLGGQVSA